MKHEKKCIYTSPVITTITLAFTIVLLSACSGDSSSGSSTGDNKDKARNYCVKIKDDGIFAKVQNTCNEDIYFRVLRNHFDEVKIKADSTKKNVNVPVDDYDFGACVVPYKPQRIKGDKFICSLK